MTAPLLEDLHGLLCLARVIELGSFTKAARALEVSKSVVSSKVAALEGRLGEQLLMRTTRQVTATDAGSRVYAHARQMIESGVAATVGASNASLRVSAPVTLAHLCLARPVAEFLEQHPGTRVELLLEDRFVDLVEERVDLAIRITRLKDSSLIARRLAWTSIHVCGSPSYFSARGRPTRPEHLLNHDCLRYALVRSEDEWHFQGQSGPIALEVRGSFETTNGAMLREAVLAGMGLAVLPRFMIADALAKGQIETVLDDFAARPLGIYAVRSGRRSPPKLVAELLRKVESAFRGALWSRSSAF
jgi:DNA-binding transcriptional LysR family regulator